MKRVLFISTGGTIASSDQGNGMKPVYSVDKLIESVKEMPEKFEIDGQLLMNIDSSNMNPKHWIKIAQTIKDNYDFYDSFVVSHGTDTMAYTASALSYMLENMNKPIILTGAQHSIEETYTDAIQNINDAVLFALEDIAGVYIAFDGKLINGTRAIKVKTKSYDAFKSVNYPYIARAKYGEIRYSEKIKTEVFQKTDSDLLCNLDLNSNIIIIKLFPGLDSGIFEFIKQNYSGVIIESFGIGGLPFEEYNIHDKIRMLTDHNIPVVITTQCYEEGVDLSVYEVGKKLIGEKIIFAGDMNTEAIVPKLMVALGKYNNISDVKLMMEQPISNDIKKIV